MARSITFNASPLVLAACFYLVLLWPVVRLLSRLERTETPARVIECSDLVLAGNRYLADYARRHASNILEFPTCIDTDRFRPVERPPRRVCRVAWIGSRH